MNKWVTEQLADWAINMRSEALPDDVLDKAGDCILDAIACAIAGVKEDAVQYAHTIAQNTFGAGDAGIWFSKMQIHPTGAAFANAASASILDLDDGNRRANGHPSAAIVPAALAVSTPETSGISVLANIVAAHEVCVRIGMSENHRSFHTGNFTGFGAAVINARANGLSVDQLMHALAVTVYHGPRVGDLTHSNDMGANVKESIPWSVVAGMVAADLAQQGFTGCRDSMDIKERYTPSLALEGLSEEGFPITPSGRYVSHAILRTYFKRYACCRWCHSAIEGLLTIIQEHNLTASCIKSIEVGTFLQSANLNNQSNPSTLESAQYSVPYCMAVAAVLGEDSLTPLSTDALNNPSAVALAEKITVLHDTELDPMFPGQNPSRVIVITANASFEEFVSVPWGEPDRTPSRVELVKKFTTVARDRMPEQQMDAIVAGVYGLREGVVGPLLDALGVELVSH